MATVYLATDLRLERRIAIKIMHNHLADDQAFTTRFVQEARSAARLAHPNVVNVFDQGQDAGTAYMVMEYLPGITLRDLLKDYTRLSAAQTVEITSAILAGLAAAHSAGIVHRDLKPENVLLANDGRIKLGDFGLARAANANTATGQALLGTIAYLSPELVTRGVADTRSDVYALGIMMYEMLTGDQPFVGDTPMQIAYQHAHDTVPKPSTKIPTVPIELDEIVQWATIRDASARPRDAREMLERLQQVSAAIMAAAPQQLSTDLTRVLPHTTLDRQVSATAMTDVIGGRAAPDVWPSSRSTTTIAAPTAIDPTAAKVTALTHRVTRRRTVGGFLLVCVLVLAGIAGTTGWYFGSGPGSLVTVPETTTLTLAEATAVLTELGFTVTPAEHSDAKIPVGHAIGTSPATGTAVRRNSHLTLNISTGPRILPVPQVTGQPEATARTTLKDFTINATSISEFSDSTDAGKVIAVIDTDGKAIPDQYPELGAMQLIVSLGGIPDVVGLKKDDATAKLTQAGLKVTTGDSVFSDTVPADSIAIQSNPKAPVRVGAEVNIQLSKGQDLVTVPPLAGLTISEARTKLKNLGFDITVNPNPLPEEVEQQVKVVKQGVASGTNAKRGTTITVSWKP